MNIDEIVNTIKYPISDIYFEKSSSDGYAFLGLARSLLKMETFDIEKKLENMAYGLNAEKTIRGTYYNDSI